MSSVFRLRKLFDTAKLRRKASPTPEAVPGMPPETALAEDPARTSFRASYRATLMPSEIRVNRFWIHDPGVRFCDETIRPDNYALSLERGVTLVNISASGALARIAPETETPILRLASQNLPEEKRSEHSIPPFRDVTVILGVNLRRDLSTLIVNGKIVRTTMIRSPSQSTCYELALHFSNWGYISGSMLEWYRVRDNTVPPIASWITQRQLLTPRQ